MSSPHSQSARDGMWVRRRIEAFGSTLSLPTARRALGLLEGAHQSLHRGAGIDMRGTHPYTAGEEARHIDWKASARAGKPMVIDYERTGNDTVWFLLDTSARMYSMASPHERIIEVATNALRMIGALAIRRGDEIALMSATAESLSRIPCNGGYRGLHKALETIEDTPSSDARNLDDLIDFAMRTSQRHSLVVIATDEAALDDKHVSKLRILAQMRPLIVITVQRVNPLSPYGKASIDGDHARRVPAFLRNQAAAEEVNQRREFIAQHVRKALTAVAATVMRADSSEAMFTTVVNSISQSMKLSAGSSSGLYSSQTRKYASQYNRQTAKE